MRFFPGAGRPRARRERAAGTARLRQRTLVATVLAVAVTVLVTTLVAPLADARDGKHALQHKQRQVQRHQKRAQGDLEESSAALRRATAALRRAEGRLHTARRHLRHVNGRLSRARAEHARVQRQLTRMKDRLADARSDLDTANRNVTDQRGQVRDSVLSEFYEGSPELIELSALMSGSDLTDLNRQEAYGAAVSSSQDATLQRLEAAKTLRTVHEHDVKDATDKVAAKEDEAAAKVARVRRLRSQAVTARDKVRHLVAKRRHAKRHAARVKAHDRRQLARLRRQEAHIRKQILAMSRRGISRHVGHTGGMFAPPVRSTYITSPYGWRRHPIYHYWGLHDGDDLHAPCGTPERAVDTGRVISQYYSSVWGHRLYLYLGRVNGHSYTAIYNHISRYRSHVGQVVGRGQVLAYAGTTGWSTACHLHFTIMRDGKAVNPTPLIGM